ncbi:MAG: alpha-1,2-fucosyltransferase [Synergistaceae bacterium]|nr:alpha-1,2-fucosyltransferase [Synergistaceae bacterium]
MITLLLSGGLGNQMFQYAFARSLALRKCTGLRISRRFLRDDDFGRSYSLDKLSLPEDVQMMTYSQELKAHSEFYFARKIHSLVNKIRGHGRDFFTGKYIYLTDYDRYEPGVMSPNYGGENITVNGLFQSQKYFRDYDAVICDELKVSVPPSPENAAMIRELSGCESVCVHVRRGDYLTLDFGNVCGYEYYAEAMKNIAGRVSHPVFCFFSNTHEDICWLNENWKFPGHDVRYVDLSNPDYEELRLMYSCRHFIIANSTLSWWGSYLSDSPRKIICAPSKWIGERRIEDTNIWLPEWTVIDTRKENDA